MSFHTVNLHRPTSFSFAAASAVSAVACAASAASRPAFDSAAAIQGRTFLTRLSLIVFPSSRLSLNFVHWSNLTHYLEDAEVPAEKYSGLAMFSCSCSSTPLNPANA